MSKAALKQSMTDFTKAVTSYQNAQKRVNGSVGLYTTQGMKEQLQAVDVEYKPRISQAAARMREELDRANSQARERRTRTINAKLNDAGYQTGLQNVVQMIKANVLPPKEDLQSVADNFKNDPAAVALISGTLKSVGRSDYIVIPTDNGQTALDMLAGITERCRGLAARAESLQSVSGFALGAVSAYIENLDKYFAEDFSLI